MADVNVADYQTIGPAFTYAQELVRVEYDFANDAGAAADDYMLWEAGADLVIHNFWAKGITELDSATDTATIDLGTDGVAEAILLDDVAEATFAADAIVKPTIVEGAPNVMPMPLKIASGGKIRMKIANEDLTSGKCEFCFLVSKM